RQRPWSFRAGAHRRSLRDSGAGPWHDPLWCRPRVRLLARPPRPTANRALAWEDRSVAEYARFTPTPVTFGQLPWFPRLMHTAGNLRSRATEPPWPGPGACLRHATGPPFKIAVEGPRAKWTNLRDLLPPHSP